MNDPKPIAVPDPDKPEFTEKDYQYIANSLIVVGLLVWICCFWLFQPGCSPADPIRPAQQGKIQKSELTTNSKNEVEGNKLKDYWTINGTRGDFTAGVVGTFFSLGAFIYLYLSFKKQREANELQLEAFNHDKIENRFFELIKLHRDNVNELKITYHIATVELIEQVPKMIVKKKTVEQRQVFQFIRNQYLQVEQELRYLFTDVLETNLYYTPYLDVLKQNETILEREINYLSYAKVDLLYLIIFFGVGIDGKETIKSITKGKYQTGFVDKLLNIASLKPKADSNYFENWYWIQTMANREELMDSILASRQNKDLPKIKPVWKTTGSTYSFQELHYGDNYEKYYGGHQFRLGHYFRHLYQSVKFINEQKELSPEQQKDYIRHLRGQLSTAEQIVFFLNSLSQLGRVWELEEKKSGAAVKRSMQMITDYGMIKNIPNDQITNDLMLSNFYPKIDYEGFEVVN